jgi:hypothetical protein
LRLINSRRQRIGIGGLLVLETLAWEIIAVYPAVSLTPFLFGSLAQIVIFSAPLLHTAALLHTTAWLLRRAQL